MNVNPVSSMATSVTAGTSVLKKAIDTQAQTALILIESIAQTQTVNPANLPPNLGQNINTTA
jgi:Putative motility protein